MRRKEGSVEERSANTLGHLPGTIHKVHNKGTTKKKKRDSAVVVGTQRSSAIKHFPVPVGPPTHSFA